MPLDNETTVDEWEAAVKKKQQERQERRNKAFENLPMNLQEWATANSPPEDMYYAGGYWNQIIFIRDRIFPLVVADLFYKDLEKDPERATSKVISAHGSKSIMLPVYQIKRPELGIEFVLRYNFYNWKLSVISEHEINVDFSGLFYVDPPVDPEYTGNCLSPVYFEGFPKDKIFSYYNVSNKKIWSAEIAHDNDLYVAVFLIMRSLGVHNSYKRYTREEHKTILARMYG